jgi:hypothetical protein
MKSKKDNSAWLKRQYRSFSPSKISREGDDGTFYPKEVTFPHISIDSTSKLLYDLIPDKKKLPRPWYELPAHIHRAADESYLCYCDGLYLASLLCSLTAIEFSVKLAYITRKGNPKIFKDKNKTLGSLAGDLGDIGLGRYKKEFEGIVQLRNGLFHFNYDKLNSSTKKILGLGDDPLDSWCIDRPAYFSYELMLQIVETTTQIIVNQHTKRG